MGEPSAARSRGAAVSAAGAAATAALVVCTALAAAVGAWKLIGISWAAFVAMAAAAALGARTVGRDPTTLTWGYGLASGAMVTSAAVFLLPQALAHHSQYGGFGVASGLLVGFGAHTIGHRLSHLELPLDRAAAELTAHALSAGAIIGVVYGNMPTLGPTLGLAIVSHKGPAGYVAAGRLARGDRHWSALLLPAAGVGVAAVAASFLALPPAPAVRGAVFGFAAGVFLHVAMDFLPRCETGSEVYEALSAVDDDVHARLDRVRVHAVVSTALGGTAVFLAWLVVA